jgi:hypothetical protein
MISPNRYLPSHIESDVVFDIPIHITSLKYGRNPVIGTNSKSLGLTRRDADYKGPYTHTFILYPRDIMCQKVIRASFAAKHPKLIKHPPL